MLKIRKIVTVTQVVKLGTLILFKSSGLAIENPDDKKNIEDILQ